MKSLNTHDPEPAFDDFGRKNITAPPPEFRSDFVWQHDSQLIS
jgi:hypothetical protein